MTKRDWIKALDEPNGKISFTIAAAEMPSKRWLYEDRFLGLHSRWENNTRFYEGRCGVHYAPTPEAARQLLANLPAELEEALTYRRNRESHWGKMD